MPQHPVRQSQHRVAALLQKHHRALGADLIANPSCECSTGWRPALNQDDAQAARSSPSDGGPRSSVGARAHQLIWGRLRSCLASSVTTTPVTSDRILDGDLYYIYMHERIGVFRVMSKLQDCSAPDHSHLHARRL